MNLYTGQLTGLPNTRAASKGTTVSSLFSARCKDILPQFPTCPVKDVKIFCHILRASFLPSGREEVKLAMGPEKGPVYCFGNLPSLSFRGQERTVGPLMLTRCCQG